MKIWHDNSGKDSNASWFLKHILIRDMQTNQKFYFLSQQWLAFDKGDGKIERDLFVANQTETALIRYLIKKEANTQIIDNHLWLSVFYRPVRSRFTRLDRVTLCFVLHYLSMLINILYYEKASFLLNSFSGAYLIDFSILSIKVQQVNWSLI